MHSQLGESVRGARAAVRPPLDLPFYALRKGRQSFSPGCFVKRIRGKLHSAHRIMLRSFHKLSHGRLGNTARAFVAAFKQQPIMRPGALRLTEENQN